MQKPRYQTTNWPKYNNSLVNWGSLTFWIDEEAITEWKQPKQDRRGRPRRFSDLAITTALMVKRTFALPFKAAIQHLAIDATGFQVYVKANGKSEKAWNQ